MPGRPTDLTPEVQRRIADAIRLGATYELAAQYGGVTYQTFRNWIVRGEAEKERRRHSRVKPGTVQWDAEQPFFEFFEAVKSAEGMAVVGWLAKIEAAANDGTWQAAAWKLERRYPKDYGRQIYEHTGDNDNPVVIKEIVVMPPRPPEASDE